MKIEVVVFREPGTHNPDWRVFVDGRLTSPSFRLKGAAQAYADMIASGYRKPEYHHE
jgi:hypothetical protein